MFEIVGREEELGSLYAFIGEAGGGLAALVLEGEAGIGKSTLWLAGLEHARTRGLRVLSSRPAEAERSLAHVGLGDLFADVLDDVLPALPAPRRRALEVALLREEASGYPVDDRAARGDGARRVADLERTGADSRPRLSAPIVDRVKDWASAVLGFCPNAPCCSGGGDVAWASVRECPLSGGCRER